MDKRKILFVLTGHDRLGKADDRDADKTGFHLSEAATPWSILTEAGFTVDFATPAGGKAPIDPSSRDLDDKDNARFLEDDRVKRQIGDTRKLADVTLSEYEAIYFPGGHGTMWDFPDSDAVKNAVRKMYEDGKVVAAVCHGPAAFVNVTMSDGRWFVQDRRMSAFTDAEEKAVEKDSVMPFLLASRLEERGAKLENADNFESSVSIDERLVTGQNPASARGVGEAIRDLVTKRIRKAA